ncbi:MAG: LicD family protein [Lachnospiraceae bacterium]|nr:LicD family protein [Lachnospiraceae bacterium]
MIELSKDYFEDEVRDGFYINGMMKRAWATQLTILSDFDALCTKYGLRYMADWGTMLGAVRHGGFIPWDDDLDVGMPRDDYNRFLEVCNELGGDYHVLNPISYEEYFELFGRVVNTRSINMNPDHLKHFHGMPFGLGIDIFPYDYIYRDDEKENDRKRRYHILARIIGMIDNRMPVGQGTNPIITKDMKDIIRQAERFTNHRILGSNNIKHELFICLDEIVSECPEHEADNISDYQNYLKRSNGSYKLSKDIFDNLIALDYENIKVPVPADYENILHIKYADFMRIVHGWSSHDFPYYSRQMDILRQHRPEFYPPYTFNADDLYIPEEIRNRESDHVDSCGLSEINGDVVFIPYKAKYWDTMRPAWEEAINNPDCNVYVIPAPYYDKTWNGQHDQMYYEKDMFPEEVCTLAPDEYDIVSNRPAVIVVQDEKDDYGETFSIHPFFYSEKLRKYTDRLILIPMLEPDAPTPKDEKAVKSMDHYVTMPGVLRANEVYVATDKLREAYIRKLKEFCGEDPEDDTQISVISQAIEDKIRVFKHKSKQTDPQSSDLDLSRYKTLHAKENAPDEWQQALKKPDGSYKKVILYEPDVSAMATHGEKMIEKIQRSLAIFKDNSEDICVILRLVPDLETVCCVLTEEEQGSFLDMLEEFASSGWGIWYPSPDAEPARTVSDAYYGDITSEVRRFIRDKKPVMIECVEI